MFQNITTSQWISRSIEQYENYPSVVAIKSKSTNKYIKFNSISKLEIEKEILNLDASKTCQDSDIPVHKKGKRLEKDNYQPVTLFSYLSKVFERCIYN